jgi:site-specific DNA recombinase
LSVDSFDRVERPSVPQQKRSLRYLRVSDPKQTRKDFNEEGISLPTQRKACARKETELGCVNVGEYIEPGRTATSVTKRPEFRKMMQRIREQRDVDYIIVDMSSRLNRNWKENGAVLLELASLGVKVVSVNEKIDGDTAIDEALQGMLAVFNGFQSRANGEDVLRKMTHKAENGGTNYAAPLGYLNQRTIADSRDDRTVVIDPDRAPLVRMAFELYATGRYTIEALTERMEELGLRSRGNKRWAPRPVPRSKIAAMLRNRYYIGFTKWNGVEYQGRHEPLISVELFEKVQRILDARSGSGTRHRKHDHYLKGSLWCGRSGHRLIIMPGRGNGGEYFYFMCRGRQEHECDAPYYRVETIEKAVLDHYTTVTFSDAFRAQLRARLDEALAADTVGTQKLRARLEGQLTMLDNKENHYLDLVGEPGWPKDKLNAKMLELHDERAKIKSELAALEAELTVAHEIFTLALDLLRDPQKLYERLAPPQRRLLNQLIFTKLKIDEETVVDDELAEPFDMIVEAGRSLTGGQRQADTRRADGTRKAASGRQRRNSASANGSAVRTHQNDLAVALLNQGSHQDEPGSSKDLWVRRQGLEPRTR